MTLHCNTEISVITYFNVKAHRAYTTFMPSCDLLNVNISSRH